LILTQPPSQQKFPAEQSVSAAQLVLQVVAPQAYGAHEVGGIVEAVHVPKPLHIDAAFSLPFVHETAPHGVVAGQSSHAPPVQRPSVPQLACVVVTHTLRGSEVPLVTAAQVPSVPPVSAAVQAWHEPVHALLQQTPSAQKPVAHWSAVVHGLPAPLRSMQTPPEQ